MSYERVETPVVRQRSATECFAVALTIILRHYGVEAERGDVREACDVSRDGANASNMLQAARGYGLTAQARRVAEVEQLQDLEPPFVVYYGFNHGIVVEGVDDEHVYVNDPIRGHCEHSHSQFRDGFTGIVFSFSPGDDFTPDRWGWEGRVVRTLAGGLWECSTASVAGIVLAAAVAGVCVVGALVAVGMGIDRPQASLPWLVGAASILGVVGGEGLRRWGHRRGASEAARRMVAQTLRHAVRLPLSYFQKHGSTPGTLWTLLSRHIAHALPRAATAYSFDVALLLTGGAWLLLAHVPIAGGLFAAGIGAVGVTVWGWRRRHAHNRDVQLSRAARQAPSLRRYETMEAYKATAPERRHVYQTIKSRTAHNNRCQRLNARQAGPVAVLAGIVGLYVLFGWGTVALRAGTDLSLGGATAAAAVVGLTGATWVRAVLRAWDLQLEYEILRERRQMLAQEPDPLSLPADEQPDPVPEAPALAADALFFRFSREGTPVVRDVGLHLTTGEHVALVGPSGCGKSSLAELLAGLRTPTDGSVESAGVSIASIPLRARPRWVGMAQSTTTLWNASLRANLVMGDGRVSETDVVEAVRDAGLRSLVDAHPDGLNQPVGGARPLSAGDRRCVEVARAFLQHSEVIIVDETTAELDDERAAHVHRALRRRTSASLTITHRMSRMDWFDRVLVMESGTIVQRGVPDDLASEAGPYAELCAPISTDAST